MPKQSSTKKSHKHSPKVAPTVEHEKISAKPPKMPKHSAKMGPVIEQEKASSKPIKMGCEIDEIFGAKKRKIPEKDTEPNTKMPVRVYVSDVNPHEGLRTVKKVHSKKSSKENRLAGPSSRQRKKTADGLTVYSEEELGFGKASAGGTRLCPFDCDCCF